MKSCYLKNTHYLYSDITQIILESSFEVINDLGAGFLESVYEKALAITLLHKNLSVKQQHPLPVSFRNQIIGEFFADLLVENKVIVELKAVKAIAPEHEAQLIHYLQASQIQVGLLINFGKSTLEYRRLNRRPHENSPHLS